MPQRSETPRAGFTLVEMLIATALSGLVLALAVKALGELSRVANLDRSRHEAQSQASMGLQKLALEIRAGNIFFYDARPLTVQAAAISGKSAQPAPREAAVPVVIAANSSPGNTRQPPGDPDLQTNKAKWSFLATQPVSSFRFTLPEDAGPPFLRLGVAPVRRTGRAVDDYFPGPLAYFAKAEFLPTAAGAPTNAYATLPRLWTFYVLYVAPMNLTDNDANVAEQYERDDFPPPLPVGVANHHRTALPLQLRLLVVPGVIAGSLANPVVPLASGDSVSFDPAVGRALAPKAVAGPTADFLEPPYDYVGTRADAQANYDPICLPMGPNPGRLLDAAAGSPYRYTNGAGVDQLRPPSGPRVAGEDVHANFNMLGNDPPSDAALANRLPGAPPVVDKMLAAYIDPDSVAGTCARFVNNMREPPAGATGDADGLIAIPATGKLYRRYLPMYGEEGGYLENRYADVWNDAAIDTSTGSYGTLPKRAHLALAIRYRTRKDLPFQFASASLEVDLDGVSAFERVRPRRRG